MKKLFALIAALIVSVSIQAADFKEGVHYRVLNTQASASPNVTEFFSFYCGHCRNFESAIAELKKKIPDNVAFQKSHITFMGGDMGIPMAKAYATMIVLEKEDTLLPEMFKQVQVLRKAPGSEADLRQWFIDKGVDAKSFDATYDSFIIDSMQKRFVKAFEDSQLRGVPGIVVNDKYVVMTEGIRSYDEYFELVNYLLNK